MSKAVRGPAAASAPAQFSGDSAKSRGAIDRRWLFHPALDIVIGCGVASAPLMVLAYPFRANSGLAIDQILFLLVAVCNYPHYMATIQRAYRTRQDLYGRRIVTIHITGLLLATLLLTYLFPRILPWIYTAFLTWSPWHYMSQNFGLTTMFARRAGARPRRRDRNLLFAAFIASYAMVFLSMHGQASPDPYVLSLRLPLIFGRDLRYVLAAVFLLSAGWALRGIANSVAGGGKWKTILPCFLLVSTEFFWFVLPPLLEAVYGFQIPPLRYAGGVLALLHSAQYLWIAAYCARRDSGAGLRWNAWTYLGVAITGGIALFVPGPWIASRLLHQDYATSTLAFVALVNLHHFFLDSSLWKMRERRAGELPALSNTTPVSTESTPGKLGDLLDWLRGSSPSARAFRRTATAALLVLAVLDQVKYSLGSDTAKPDRLNLAAALNPNDSSLWLNIAAAQAGDGHPDAAMTALQRAVQVNPHRFDAQRALALYYLQNEKYDEARAQYERMTHNLALDSASWANYGTLESRSGNTAQALADWKRAEVLDPNNVEVHLYLAETSFGQGDDREAIRHYETYLTLLPKTYPADRIDPRTLGLSCLKLGTAYERSGNIERARFYNEKAALLFQQTKNTNLESVARFHLADTLRQLKRPVDALRNYQAGLDLDRQSGNDPTTGADWFVFARFLQQINAPPRFILAAYLESEKLLGDKAETAAREKLEKEMGHDADNVHKELAEWVHSSLSYKMP
jgi:tetratricopeptide (TPR) repeat protein